MRSSTIEKENAECLMDLWNHIREVQQKETAFWKNQDSQATFWDRRAESYTKNVPSDRKDKSNAVVFNLLKTAGFKPEGKTILDIGSGPGTLALPLARMGAEVVALDVSENMLKSLREKAAGEGIKSIETIHMSWHDADLEKLGFGKKFDLVIASMTPAVSDVNSFIKMMGASRGLCYYSGFMNRMWDASYYDLYSLLFGEEYKDSAMGFYIPFMYVYALGYRPAIRLNKEVWPSDDTVEGTAGTIRDFFSQHKEISPNAMVIINKYLEQRSKDGKYHSETNVIIGKMLWEVSRKPGRS